MNISQTHTILYVTYSARNVCKNNWTQIIVTLFQQDWSNTTTQSDANLYIGDKIIT